MPKLTLQPNKFTDINISARYFILLSASKVIEFTAHDSSDVDLTSGDIVDCIDEIGKTAKLRNNNSVAVEIDYIFNKQKVEKNASDVPLKIAEMPAVQVQASIAAANDASAPATITLAAGETKLVLAENQYRHKAILVRGDTDLYNLRLGYDSTTNAQNGVWFAPQATAKIEVTKAVYAHNPSATTQTIIAQDTSINTGV